MALNKDKHTCNSYIVKPNNGSIDNRVIQSNQDVHVCGIWWISVYVVANSNSTFALQNESIFFLRFSELLKKTRAIFILSLFPFFLFFSHMHP